MKRIRQTMLAILALFESANGSVESLHEALRTATVNAATYLDAEQEFGKIAAGLRADLVMPTGNPLEDISYTRTRVGVMKAGRWFPGDELDTALARLAEARK